MTVNLKESKLLITGASGSLGKQILYELNKQGIKPIVQVRKQSDTTYIDSLGLEKRYVDFQSDSDLSELVEGIDLIIHCAAKVDFQQGRLTQITVINALIPAKLFMAAQKAGVKRFCHVSTVAAVGAIKRMVDGVRADESELCRECCPFNLEYLKIPYIQSKHAAEVELNKVAEGSPTELVIVNPAIIIGPSQSGYYHQIALKLFRQIIAPEIPIRLNMVDVRDVAPGVLAALEKGENGKRYILAGDNITVSELVLAASAIMGRAPHLVRFPRRFYDVTAHLNEKFGKLIGRSRITFYPDLVRMLDFNWVYSSSNAYENLHYRWRSIYTTLEDLLSDNFNNTWMRE